MSEIDYPHIPRQTLFPEASAKLVRVDLQRRGHSIGYVMGSGDEVPEALRQVGYDVTMISDDGRKPSIIVFHSARSARRFRPRDGGRPRGSRVLPAPATR